jgi:hypothetical protein
MPPLLQYVFVAWCSLKARGHLYLYKAYTKFGVEVAGLVSNICPSVINCWTYQYLEHLLYKQKNYKSNRSGLYTSDVKISSYPSGIFLGWQQRSAYISFITNSNPEDVGSTRYASLQPPQYMVQQPKKPPHVFVRRENLKLCTKIIITKSSWM